ncbi:biotin synthase [Marinitoga sp. 1135]|uniref:Putative DNA modification/repair radical SAM protein n=1 Tax=Marinitoga piezophila (strain DSM 14283 / JCM 11233 / KA3) TaxID=443254 RepID=H2J7F6_MARPK|nr:MULTISPECIES: putative DNA modification/repair radical SAM protein [Marinitoga]AEX86449.1 putative DNA modification/repair radical SAM protein [Marinitoga piezophila KA3]APT76836.1 biotin synthase [Marinitoga sp. 1137]NUU96595.1 biotin synthase [Marinitoga sp. 1135]NUU98525.1 biotin synthase [Marinitoga sp. 1138]
MDINEKLRILSSSAKYDVSCASSGSDRNNEKKGIGNAVTSGVCHSWTSDGRCISLLKILFSNACIYDCAYCINRASNDVKRATFTVDEVVQLTMNFYRRNYIEGLFLSSAIIKSPDYTMEQMLKVVKKLRKEENFNGYIHLKAIPGADLKLIREAGFYADRLSVNIELPSEKSLKLLAPQKKKENIIKPMKFLGTNILANVEDRKKYKKTPLFVPAGHSTQLIVGASPESDYQILRLAEGMYKKFNMKRVYYSAFIPVNKDKRLPINIKPPLKREHRLYQADWLLRFYKFSASEILNEKNPFLDEKLDPKTSWALRNFHFFPIEINRASYDELIRVPGIGIKSALTIIKARKYSPITFDDLKKIGVVLKRAKYFITCNGKYYSNIFLSPDAIREKLTENLSMKIPLFPTTAIEVSRS